MNVNFKKVLITDDINQDCINILEKNNIEVKLDITLAKNKDELLKVIKDYDALIVRSATKVTEDVIRAGTNLKLIGRAGTGTDNIDKNAATEKGIIVMNTPGGNTLSAAEHTCALICSLARKIPQAFFNMRNSHWKKNMGEELYGKTLAIIGLGRIGRLVAERMQSFGMTTIGYDPIINASTAKEFGVQWLSLEEIWKLADYITVHVPLIPQTANLINKDVFEACKKGVKILNVARGGIINEDDLLSALQSGQCGGAALDVFIEEPPKWGALHQHENCIVTPHLGANTREAQARVAKEIAEQIINLKEGHSLFGDVNAAAFSNAFSSENLSLLALAKMLAKVALKGQSNVKSVTVITEKRNSKISQALKASAVLECMTAENVSLLNAVSVSLKEGFVLECDFTKTDEGNRMEVSVGSVTAAGHPINCHSIALDSIGEFNFLDGVLVSNRPTLLFTSDESKLKNAVKDMTNVCSIAFSTVVKRKQFCLLTFPTQDSTDRALALLKEIGTAHLL